MKEFTGRALHAKNVPALRKAYKQHISEAARIKRILAKIGSQIAKFEESDDDEVEDVVKLIGDKTMSVADNVFMNDA